MLPIWIDFGALAIAELIPFFMAAFVVLTFAATGFVGRT